MRGKRALFSERQDETAILRAARSNGIRSPIIFAIRKMIFVVVIAFAPLVQATEIFFVNGDRLTGTVLERSDETMILETDLLGVVTVPTSAVVADDLDIPIDASLSTGERTLYAAAPPAADWDAQADMGYVVSTGNTETTDISLIVGAKRSGPRVDHVVGINIAQAESDDSTGTTVKTKDKLDLDYEFRWNASPTWYALGNVEYFSDGIKDIDSRVSVGLGGGRTFWKNERGSLTSDLGISQVFEELGDESESNPALRWGLRYGFWLRPDEIELFHDNQVLHILDSGRGTVWSSGSGIRLFLNEHWNAGLRVGLQYETKPNVGREKTDMTVALTLGARL